MKINKLSKIKIKIKIFYIVPFLIVNKQKKSILLIFFCNWTKITRKPETPKTLRQIFGVSVLPGAGGLLGSSPLKPSGSTSGRVCAGLPGGASRGWERVQHPPRGDPSRGWEGAHWVRRSHFWEGGQGVGWVSNFNNLFGVKTVRLKPSILIPYG